MLFDDSYRTLAERSEGIYRDKGSKFLAFAFPVKKIEGVKEIVQSLQEAHPKANHHCWALRLTPDRGIFKINDDGEPSGTAGRPILNVLLSQDITDVVVVVVRYFGGTLLGVPGLINAYRTAALEAIGASRVVEMTINDIYELSFEQDMMNPVMRTVKEENLKILSQKYLEGYILKISVRKSGVNKLLSRLSLLHKVHVKYLYSA